MILKNTDYQTRLKERFIVLQDYAQLIFLTEIGLKDCVNDGIYSSSIKECMQCDLADECQHFSPESNEKIRQGDLNNVIENMSIAKNYVQRKTVHNIQEDGFCYCDSCAWLAEFDRTLSESISVIRYKLNDVKLAVESTKNKIKEIKL